MTDSGIIKALFTLLRSGLWEKDVDDIGCFPLKDTEWEVLYNIAIEQTIEGLIYDGIQRLPNEYLPPKSILLRLVVRLNKIENQNKKMNDCIQEQVLFFKEIGVSPILLKGQGIADYYPIKNHRVCGDIDWYFDDVQESKQIEELLLKKYVRFNKSTVESCSYNWRSCHVEHHIKLFDVFNPIAYRRLEKIKKEKLSNQKVFYEDKNYRTLPSDLNIIQVNLHILKHLLAFGIGLRQICDSAILYDRLKNDYNKEWLFDVYKDLKVINWIYLLHELLVKYIGLAESKLPFQANKSLNAKWMLDDILSTGNFGFHDTKFTLIRENNTIQRRNKSGKLWYSFKRYFPLAPYEALSFPVIHFVHRFKHLAFG